MLHALTIVFASAEGEESSDDAPGASTELPEDPEVLPEAPDAPPADEPEPKPE